MTALKKSYQFPDIDIQVNQYSEKSYLATGIEVKEATKAIFPEIKHLSGVNFFFKWNDGNPIKGIIISNKFMPQVLEHLQSFKSPKAGAKSASVKAGKTTKKATTKAVKAELAPSDLAQVMAEAMKDPQQWAKLMSEVQKNLK